MEYIQNLTLNYVLRLKLGGLNKAGCVAGAACLPTTDGCKIYSVDCKICAEFTMIIVT